MRWDGDDVVDHDALIDYYHHVTRQRSNGVHHCSQPVAGRTTAGCH